KAKASWKSKGMTADAAHLIELAQKAKTTEFTGYEELSSQANVVLLSNGKEHVTSLSQGVKGILVVDKTPFYAESGGQVGDRGFASSSDTQVKIENCTRQNDVFFHFIEVVEGSLKQGDEITLQVDD